MSTVYERIIGVSGLADQEEARASEAESNVSPCSLSVFFSVYICIYSCIYIYIYFLPILLANNYHHLVKISRKIIG